VARFSVVLVSLSFTAFAVGCRPDSVADNPAPAEVLASAEAQATYGSDERARLGIPLEDATPFSAYLDYVDGPKDGSYEADQQTEAAAFADQQDAIASCMKGRGFEYSPQDWDLVRIDRFEADSAFAQGDQLWLAWLPASRDEVEERGYGKLEPRKTTVTQEDVDPVNFAYRESLSPAQQEAYDLALGGEQEPDTEGDPGTEPSCFEITESAVSGAGEVPSGRTYQQFAAQFGALAAQMEQLPGLTLFEDGEVRALDLEYEVCMGRAGFDLGSGREYAPGEVNPWAAFSLAQHTRADGSLGSSWNAGPDFAVDAAPIEERSLLGTQAEIKIALADFDCRVETDYDRRLKDAYLRLEAEFVAAHKSELDQMKAFVEEHS
jgi:hypothetical protein